MFKKLNPLIFVFAGVLIALQPLVPLIQKVSAAELVDQSIEVCFVGLDSEGKVISSIEGNTSISLDLYTEGVHLEENKVNSYGSGKINLSGTNAISPNTKLNTDNGLIDAYCTTKTFKNAPNHEYTYSRAAITSDLDWKEIRYNDEVSIDFVDPDIAFPYSGEWFDDVVGNESIRNQNADGHIVMNSERSHRRLVIVAQLDQNLPDYGVIFRDSAPTSLEYTLGTLPNKLQPNSTVNLRFTVINAGKLTWLSALSGVSNPVNVSYHWKNVDTGEYYQYEGNRALLSQPEVKPTFNDSNISLTLNTPTQPGNYQLILDLVHEGITWFSQAGADTKTFNIQVGEPRILSSFSDQSAVAAAVAGSYYTVQPPQGGNWHCWGSDCLTGIAEDYYHCNANGISNNTSGDLTTKCWWPIYAANLSVFANVPPEFASHPWDYLQVGWVLYIPPFGGGGTGPVPSNNFTGGVLGSTPVDPYAGMNGAYQPWPQITFDRFIAWDGSYKVDQIKWTNQETVRPNAPTITAMSTDAATNSVTIYGVAIPKGHPMHIRVWNEYRYCWACGSGWDFHYQQGSAQHVKVVLFKEGWQYLGELWNDRSDGRWSITLPLGANLNTGDKVFAEVQIEADYTFNNLRWWSDTYETVNFNIRNPKYFGWPYFASGGSLPVTVPKVIVDNRSDIERAIDDRAGWLNATGAKDFTHICNVPAKEFTNLKNGQPGAIFFINNRTVYSWGGTWDTFMWYGDRCERFGAPINDPVDPAGVGPQNTAGAYQDFQNGRIYWSWKHLGKFLYGTIWNKFELAGGTNSNYGWPTSETYSLNQNGISSTCQNFEGGTICDTGYQPEQGVVFEDFTGVENEEVLLEPDIGGAFSEALSTFISEFEEYMKASVPPPFDIFEGLAKDAEMYAHFLYGALKGVVESVVDAIVFVKEVIADGKLQQVIDGLVSLIHDPKLLGYILQDQIETFTSLPFLQKIEMLGNLTVNAILIAAAGYGIAKGAVNLLSKGVTAMKEAIIAGNFGEQLTKFVYGGVEAVIGVGKNGLTKIGDIVKSVKNLSWDKAKTFIGELLLSPKQKAYALITAANGNPAKTIFYTFRDNALIWLEEGKSGSSGLVHILEGHWDDFVSKFSIASKDDLVSLIKTAVSKGVTSPNEPGGGIIYTYLDETGKGVKVYTATNGYIIGAHPF